MRRALTWLLALLLISSLLSGCAAKTTNPERQPIPSPMIEGTEITIHYHRYQSDYDDWDLWVWPVGMEGQGYTFAKKDDYGVVALINFDQRFEQVGFIVRKGGDSWSDKDITIDRFIEVKDGKAEVWVIQDQEAFGSQPEKISKEPQITAAYLDSRRLINVKLTHPIELQGTGADGFRLDPPVEIESVHDARIKEIGLLGYEFLAQNLSIRFVLVPGRLGFPAKNADGAAEVYVSGTFNNWGNAVGGIIRKDPSWLMAWNAGHSRYELVKSVGSAPGQVPISGAEFKFTHGSDWHPSANIRVIANAGLGTTEVLLTLAKEAEINKDYFVAHDRYRKAPLQRRGVLDDPAFVYLGNDLGHTYSLAATGFRIWAPTAKAAEVLIYDVPVGGTPRATALQSVQGGTWFGELPGDLEGKYYTYRLQLGATTTEVMDPYAIGAGIQGNRALVVNMEKTNPMGWESTPRPPFKNPTDAVIWEVHVRDLSMNPQSGIENKGKFLGFTETGTKGPNGVKTGIDHIKELGVTHVQLLPVFDFATVDETRKDQYNWGYDPKNYNVPEGSYGTNPNGTVRIREFKQMVQALHHNGLRVVMDVVYNHTSVGASPFEAIAPHYYYRWDASGRMANGSGTGNETASERPMVRKFIVDSVRFWATEYKLDGFRFDLMALHDLETMRQVRQALDEIDPSIIVYGEPWMGGDSPLDPAQRLDKGKQRGMQIAVFNDHIRNSIKGDNDGIQRGFATGGGGYVLNIQRGVAGSIEFDSRTRDFALHPSESINYASAHDNLTLWDKLARSNGTEPEEARIRMNLLAQAIVLTSQGIPFLHAGEEMLRSKGGEHNSYKSPDSVNQLNWSRKSKYPQVFAYYQGLIQLRLSHPAFRLPTGDMVREHLEFLETPPNTVGFWLKENAGGDDWKNIVVIFNPNPEAVEVALPNTLNWSIAVQEMQIGNLPGTVSDRTQVAPISTLVLYQK